MSVCLFFMHFDIVRANAIKLFRNSSFIKRKVESYFSPKNTGPPPVTGPSIYRTNDVAAFCSIEELLSSTL